MTKDQEVALHLAGTVRFPSPSPATGEILIVLPADSGTSESGALDPESLHLKIQHRISPRLALTRVLRLVDVRSLHAPWPKEQGGTSHATTKTVIERALAWVQENGARPGAPDLPWLTGASVFVRESVPVVMNVEVSLTAAESADYYPPLGSRFGESPNHPDRRSRMQAALKSLGLLDPFGPSPSPCVDFAEDSNRRTAMIDFIAQLAETLAPEPSPCVDFGP